MNRADWTARITGAVSQFWYDQGVAVLDEFTLKTNRRVDLICLDDQQNITVIEIKSSDEDFLADRKWQEYLDWADRFFFAIPEHFTLSLLPDDDRCGIIITDGFSCHIQKHPVQAPLHASRRQHLLRRLAHVAMDRHFRLKSGLMSG